MSVVSGIVCVIAFLPGIFVEFQSPEDGETDVEKDNAEALAAAQEQARGRKDKKKKIESMSEFYILIRKSANFCKTAF